MKYIVLTLIYLYVMFMAWSAFGWMGIAYVVIIPIPLVLFSWLIRRKKRMHNTNANAPVSLWTSPIPYLSLIFIAMLVFHFVGQ